MGAFGRGTRRCRWRSGRWGWSERCIRRSIEYLRWRSSTISGSRQSNRCSCEWIDRWQYWTGVWLDRRRWSVARRGSCIHVREIGERITRITRPSKGDLLSFILHSSILKPNLTDNDDYRDIFPHWTTEILSSYLDGRFWQLQFRGQLAASWSTDVILSEKFLFQSSQLFARERCSIPTDVIII